MKTAPNLDAAGGRNPWQSAVARCCTAASTIAVALVGLSGSPRAEAQSDWQWVGRQGIVQIVVVPADQITDEGAYRAQIDKLCQPEHTCFINFYANSTGAPVTLPLPDSVAAEATATFRRSTKAMVERLQWSCRLNLARGECF